MKEVKCGDNAIISYNPEDKSYVRMFHIRGTGAIDCSSFFNSNGYTGCHYSDFECRIFINEGITEICDNSFPCKKIKVIHFPKSFKK